MGYDIFISFTPDDRVFAETLIKRLEREGLHCWPARRALTGGEPSPEAVYAAVRQAPTLLLLFSQAANASPEVARLLALAADSKCLIIPVRLDDAMPVDELERHLSSRTWVDVCGLTQKAAMAQVLEEIVRYSALLKSEGYKGYNVATGRKTLPSASISRPPQRKRHSAFPLGFLGLFFIVLVVGAAFFLTRQATLEEAPLRSYLGTVLPASDAELYTYSDQAGISVTTLRLSGDDHEEYLVRMTGVSGPAAGYIFRCSMVMKQGERRFASAFDGQPYVPFILDGARGRAFPPNSANEYLVQFEGKSAENSEIMAFMASWREQEKRRQEAVQ